MSVQDIINTMGYLFSTEPGSLIDTVLEDQPEILFYGICPPQRGPGKDYQLVKQVDNDKGTDVDGR